MKKICNKDSSVFAVPYHERWWNLPALLRRFKNVVRNTYYRAVYGFCPYDTWNMHYHISNLMANMLTYLKEEHYGYPGDMTDEEYTAYLDKLAKLFAYVDIEEDEITQHLFDKYEAICDEKIEQGINPWKSNDKDIADAWSEYSKASIELDKRREAALSEALDLLKERYFHLWD